jgi:ribosomal protein S18 acetylase RimI-like enzyme
VGFATWADAAGVSELEDLFVDPDCRRQGIATAQVREIVDILRARGVERIEVTANPHAMGFYTAVGFTDCGVATTEFGEAPRMVLGFNDRCPVALGRSGPASTHTASRVLVVGRPKQLGRRRGLAKDLA